MKKFNSNLLKTIGPGILFAGAAIGGSHLVQSTRAGANYGFSLVWIVVAVLIFKYPFFEFSHRYTAATGESILEGYKRLGRKALMLFFVSALVVSVINAAAVSLVTASLAGNFLGIELSPFLSSAFTVVIVLLLIILGKYPVLDKVMKFMIIILSIFTIIAVALAFSNQPDTEIKFYDSSIWELAGVSFLLALMGWMPAPIDVSVFPSLWTLERKKETNYKPSVKEALIDFNIGYIGTGILALAFISLGALIMHNSGEQFSNSGIKFASQLIDLYVKSLGSWSKFLIALIAFITMFSTSLTVFDGYSRTISASIELLWDKKSKVYFFITLFVLAAATLLIIGVWLSGIKTLIDIATIIAFITAPVFAIINYLTINLDTVDKNFKPSKFLKILSIFGIMFLIGFTLLYIYWQII